MGAAALHKKIQQQQQQQQAEAGAKYKLKFSVPLKDCMLIDGSQVLCLPSCLSEVMFVSDQYTFVCSTIHVRSSFKKTHTSCFVPSLDIQRVSARFRMCRSVCAC